MVPIALKSSQPPWQTLIRPMLLLSLGLHGLLLMLPTSPVHQPEPPAEEKVSLTQLPTESSSASPVAPSTRPTPVAPTPRAVATPPPRSIAPPRVAAPPPLRTAAAPTPALAASTPAASTQPSPAATAPSATPAPPADPFAAGFPHYPNAQPGSFGLPPEYESASQKTSDAMSAVASFFEQQLRAGGYTIAPLQQAGRTVYQVMKGNITKTLTLIPNPDGAGTSIILSDQPLPEDLGSADVESPAVARFYQDLPVPPDASWHDVNELTEPLDTLIASPADFFTSLGGVDAGGFYTPPEPRGGYIKGVVGAGDPTTAFANLQPQLQSFQFNFTPAGSYGGGSVYAVSRTDQYPPNEQVTRYLVLVPTQDNRTIIFVWDRNPQS
jgi:hypothetical protein